MKKKIIKSFNKKRTQAIKKSRFLLRHPLVVPVSSFVLLFFIGLTSFIFLGASTQGASDARIVNVFFDGNQQTVTTRAKNVGELIQRLQLPVVKEDIVEPARDSLILEDDTQVNVYKARPVEIIDRGRTLTLFTAQRAPRLVAAEAGLELVVEDEVAFDRSESSVLESGVSEQLVVERSVEVQINIYGAIKTIRTTADTVAEVLSRESVTQQPNEAVEPALSTPVTAGMLISLNKEGVKTAVVTEPIPFTIETQDDPELEAGKVRLERDGILGERAVVYEIIEEAGVEISRKELQQVVVKQPTNGLQYNGTKIVKPSFNPSVTVSGDKAALMSAAGIAESDYAFADFIISRESGWRPGAVNSYSGAYGLCQSLPASKMASAGADYLTNPVTQLRWCSGYASGRYGGWSGAYNAWLAQSWW